MSHLLFLNIKRITLVFIRCISNRLFSTFKLFKERIFILFRNKLQITHDLRINVHHSLFSSHRCNKSIVFLIDMFLTTHRTIERILLKTSSWACWRFSRLSVWCSLWIRTNVIFNFLFIFELLLFMFFESLHFFFMFSLICLVFCLSVLWCLFSNDFIVSKNLLFSSLKFKILFFLNRISHYSHQFRIIYCWLHRFKITRSYKSMPERLTVFIEHIFNFILLFLLHFFCLTFDNFFKVIWKF